ncbi:MAG TPA: pilin [Nevskiaceae bacterium]|nr:pilin [Nevskiaceae bacterium]
MKKLALNLPDGYEIQDPIPTITLPGGGEKPRFENIGDIINTLIPYIFALAGIILLFFIIFGGFELLTSGGDPKKVESAKGKITHAIVGFIIIFVAYWLVQILETIFGIQIF